MPSRQYVLYLSIFLVCYGLAATAFNAFIDPYLIIGSERREGINAIKVEINEHVRLSKAYHPAFETWDTLIVGNSRVEIGLDPEHSCFKSNARRVYNLGLPGAGLRLQLEYALNVIDKQPIDHVMLSLDFVDFLVEEGATLPPKNNLGNDSETPRYISQAFIDYYQALFSLDALYSSIKTFSLQSLNRPDRTDQGFNPARDFKAVVVAEGTYSLFAQKIFKLNQKYSQPKSLWYSDGTPTIDFKILHEFLDISSDRGIRVTLFTNPFHEEFWRLLKEQGLYELHQHWIEMLYTLVNELDRKNIVLWDFSGDSPYIHEPVPDPTIRAEPLQWFWEPTHYRKELGDLMLNTMLAKECGSTPKFGNKLK